MPKCEGRYCTVCAVTEHGRFSVRKSFVRPPAPFSKADFLSDLKLYEIEYGRIPERPKGADCKSVVFDFDGSNPSSPTKKKTIAFAIVFFSYIRPWRVILFRSDIRIKPSDIGLRPVLWPI